MVIELDFASDTPIYVQLRNQIVKGIGKGELKAGEKLPTVRQLASDAGVNTMTVNKTYQILKAEGFIKTDRSLVHLSPRILIWILNSGKSLNQSLSCCQQKQALPEWTRKNS
nr:GntR family transcriptional regulator [Lachnospira eligens]